MDYQNLGRCVFMDPDNASLMCDRWSKEYFGEHANADIYTSGLKFDEPIIRAFNLKPDDKDKVIALIRKYDSAGLFDLDDPEELDIRHGFEFPLLISTGIFNELAPKIGLKSVGHFFFNPGTSFRFNEGGIFFVEKEMKP